jgi:hypothetical protein
VWVLSKDSVEEMDSPEEEEEVQVCEEERVGVGRCDEEEGVGGVDVPGEYGPEYIVQRG